MRINRNRTVKKKKEKKPEQPRHRMILNGHFEGLRSLQIIIL